MGIGSSKGVLIVFISAGGLPMVWLCCHGSVGNSSSMLLNGILIVFIPAGELPMIWLCCSGVVGNSSSGWLIGVLIVFISAGGLPMTVYWMDSLCVYYT